MHDPIKQEQFEIEVLEKLNSKRFLDHLVFTGGTMLRLCFGLNRFSVDLDFWIIKEMDTDKFFKDMLDYLSRFYFIKDAENEFYTILFEIKSNNFPKGLKIEIRKEKMEIETERAIAYSRFSNIQVFLKVVSLKDMMKAKIEAFLERKEIRDVFDIEFLVKKGIKLHLSPTIAKTLLDTINSLSKKDYTVKLGSLLEERERRYYIDENFKILKAELNELIKLKS